MGKMLNLDGRLGDVPRHGVAQRASSAADEVAGSRDVEAWSNDGDEGDGASRD